MARRHNPVRGSRGYSPRKRAKKQTVRLVTWAKSAEGKLLGFAGYKAGMTHSYYIDDSEFSATKGQEIFTPCTVVETPPLVLFGARAYVKTPYGLRVVSQGVAEKLDKELDRRIMLPKDKQMKQFSVFEQEIGPADEIRALVHTQPIKVTGVPKKAPEIMEMNIGGSKDTQLAYVKEKLGKEIPVGDILKPGEMLDVIAVTKGKGTQGVHLRFGTKLRKRKHAHEFTRQIGTLGGRMGTKWTIPMAGQDGYQRRTDLNKRLLAVNKSGVTPKGGFPHYGEVRNECILIKGSIPGPRQRLVRVRHAVRAPKAFKAKEPSVTYISLEPKQ